MAREVRELTADEIRTEENALMDFQFAIIDELRARDLSKSDFAKMLGVSRARVSQMLSSEANPTIKLVGRAAAVLGLSVEYKTKPAEQEQGAPGASAEADLDSIFEWITANVATANRVEPATNEAHLWRACQRVPSARWVVESGQAPANHNKQYERKAA